LDDAILLNNVTGQCAARKTSGDLSAAGLHQIKSNQLPAKKLNSCHVCHDGITPGHHCPAPSEAEPFWSFFLKGPLRRGLKGVKRVISNAHEGLKAAIAKTFGAAWQRCRVHWMRNALAHVSKG